jgi:hypothetical protein
MARVCVGTLSITASGLTMPTAHEATRRRGAVERVSSRRGAACCGEIAVRCRSPSRRRGRSGQLRMEG